MESSTFSNDMNTFNGTESDMGIPGRDPHVGGNGTGNFKQKTETRPTV